MPDRLSTRKAVEDARRLHERMIEDRLLGDGRLGDEELTDLLLVPYPTRIGQMN